IMVATFKTYILRAKRTFGSPVLRMFRSIRSPAFLLSSSATAQAGHVLCEPSRIVKCGHIALTAELADAEEVRRMSRDGVGCDPDLLGDALQTEQMGARVAVRVHVEILLAVRHTCLLCGGACRPAPLGDVRELSGCRRQTRPG